MTYALAVCIALTIVNLGAIAWLIVTRPQQPDAVVMGQQLQALKLGVTDLSERLDALYRKDRTAAAREAKEKPSRGEPLQQPLDMSDTRRRSKAELRALLNRTKGQIQ